MPTAARGETVLPGLRSRSDIVLFASVLFLVAIAQRFKVRSVRIATTTIAFGLAAYTTVAVATLPRV